MLHALGGPELRLQRFGLEHVRPLVNRLAHPDVLHPGHLVRVQHGHFRPVGVDELRLGVGIVARGRPPAGGPVTGEATQGDGHRQEQGPRKRPALTAVRERVRHGMRGKGVEGRIRLFSPGSTGGGEADATICPIGAAES